MNIVQVYYNLHKRMWSVREKSSGHVACHAEYVQLSDVRFVVSTKGRERVLREQRKNVHAWVEGEFVEALTAQLAELRGRPEGRAVTYNPYRHATFVYRSDLAPIHTADGAILVALPDAKPNVYVI